MIPWRRPDAEYDLRAGLSHTSVEWEEESMTSVTIFGSGNMGTAIDELLTAGGTTVDHIGSADPPGPVNGDIVILAVYYAALQDILREYGDKFAGKVVVDITNP